MSECLPEEWNKSPRANSASSNEITCKARAMGYLHKASGMRYAHVDAPRDTLPKLQEIRHNCFVFEKGRIWEL